MGIAICRERFSAACAGVFIDCLAADQIEVVIPPRLTAGAGAELDLFDARTLDNLFAAVLTAGNGRFRSGLRYGANTGQTIPLAISLYGRERYTECRCDIGIAAVFLPQLSDL